jgi:hypothetical protein
MQVFSCEILGWNMKECIVMTILVFLIGVFITALLLIPAYYFDKAKCESQSISFEDSRFGIIQGCMVKHEGKWLPLENIRGFD